VLAIEVDRTIDADRTVRVLDRIIVVTGRPLELLHVDNGPDLTAHTPSRLVSVLSTRARPTSNQEAPS
jgi:hypothetical protein